MFETHVRPPRGPNQLIERNRRRPMELASTAHVGRMRLNLLGERRRSDRDLYVDVFILPGKYVSVLRWLKQKLMNRFSMTSMGDVSLVLGMGVASNLEKEAVTITQENCTKPLLERYGMTRCDPTYTPGVEK